MSPETNKWYPCPDMPELSSWWNRAALIESRIYSLSHGSYGLTSCVCFDPREITWYSLGDRAGGPEERHELFPYNGSLFCLTSKDFKRLHVRANKWELMPFMRFEKCNMATKRTDEVKSIFRQKCENFDFATIAHKMRSNREHFGFSLDIDGGIIYVHKVMFESKRLQGALPNTPYYSELSKPSKLL
ncbi:uncharacterized protein ACN2A1_006995 isoform 1-T1 [Glossina fuscipes fuscipes]